MIRSIAENCTAYSNFQDQEMFVRLVTCDSVITLHKGWDLDHQNEL